ncbi:MAG: hypothetical protein WAM97_06760, partial [Acidimicrobiales bacterium]
MTDEPIKGERVMTDGFLSQVQTEDAMRSAAEIIGREDVNDLEEILSVVNEDWDEPGHAVRSNFDTTFTWDY